VPKVLNAEGIDEEEAKRQAEEEMKEKLRR